MARRNVLAAWVLLTISVGYGYSTAALPERAMPNTPGPAFLPWLITAALTALSVALLFQGLRSSSPSTPLPPPIAPRGWLGLAAFAAYLALLPVLGFLLASIPFFAALALLYGPRNRGLAALSALVIPTLLLVVFRFGFQMPLPRGIWW